MDPLTAGVTIGGGLIDAVGGLFGNSSSSREAMKNRRFQRYMSEHAHQNEVRDLKKAGLNPMLSGMGGSGAATPSGATASQSNPFDGVANSARDLGTKMMQSKMNQAQIDNMHQENERLKEQTRQLQISNAQQSILTPAYIEAGKAVDSGIKGVKKILGVGDAGDLVQDVLDAGAKKPIDIANGTIELPTGAFDLRRLVGTEKSEARKWANGEKGFLDSIFDASKEAVRINSAKKLSSEDVRKFGLRKKREEEEKAKGYFKWDPSR